MAAEKEAAAKAEAEKVAAEANAEAQAQAEAAEAQAQAQAEAVPPSGPLCYFKTAGCTYFGKHDGPCSTQIKTEVASASVSTARDCDCGEHAGAGRGAKRQHTREETDSMRRETVGAGWVRM